MDGLTGMPAALAEIDDLRRLLAAEKQERKRLEEIVAKLPKTADGVPMRLGMNMVIVDDDNHLTEAGLLAIAHEGKDTPFEIRARDGDGDEYDLCVSDCYSTRAAAEQASQDSGRGGSITDEDQCG